MSGPTPARDAAVRDAAGSDEAAIVRFTIGKGVANTALRWVPPFLPTLERAFGATTTQLTTVLGLSELTGLTTVLTGRHLDRGRERIVATVGLASVSLAAVVALIGTTASFAASMVLVVFGVAHCTVAGHTFISQRVPYGRRARAIGLFETSWALSLLVGAPVIAALIAGVGWRGPYVMLAVLAAVVGTLIGRNAVREHRAAHRTASPHPAGHGSVTSGPGPDATVTSGPGPDAGGVAVAGTRLDRRAWLVVVGSAGIAMTGLSIFAISGSWLDDAFGVPTGGLGAVAMAAGAVELASSLTSASVADRFGKLRGTVAALGLVLVGLAVMSVADDRLAVGVVGILCFLCGFEFSIVTSFSLVSEAMPAARGRTIALSNAIGTLARGTGTILGGWLYGRWGIEAAAALSAGAALVAASCLVLSRR